MASTPHFDLHSLGDQFKGIGADAQSLTADIKTLRAVQGLTDDQEQRFASLLQRATDGQSKIAEAVREARQARVDKLSADIRDQESTLLLDLSADTRAVVQSHINALAAERAELLTHQAGDYSDVISPADVSRLVALLEAADQDIRTRQKLAAAIPILMMVVDLAARIAGAVASAF